MALVMKQGTGRNVYDVLAISTLTVVNVSRNGRGALYKPLKLQNTKNTPQQTI